MDELSTVEIYFLCICALISDKLLIFLLKQLKKYGKISSFQSLLTAGYKSQVAFLQSKIILPFLNQQIYANSGQLAEKVPKGLALTGNKDGITSFVSALRTELLTQTGRKWSYVKRSKQETFHWSGDAEKFLRSLFQKGRDNLPAIIFLEDVQSWANDSQNWNQTRIVKIIAAEMGKTEPGQILPICNLQSEILLENDEIKALFPIHLDIPYFLSTPQAKIKCLREATAKWGHPLGDEIIQTIAQKMGQFSVQSEDEIRYLATSSYRRCLDAYHLKKGGNDKVNLVDINPSLQDWEETLKDKFLLRGNIQDKPQIDVTGVDASTQTTFIPKPAGRSLLSTISGMSNEISSQESGRGMEMKSRNEGNNGNFEINHEEKFELLDVEPGINVGVE